MEENIYIKPEVFSIKFTCPHCKAISEIRWWSRTKEGKERSDRLGTNLKYQIRVGYCMHCHDITLWYLNECYYPRTNMFPNPYKNMPENVKRLYKEATDIGEISPRGAAALLRLAIQQLCVELGEPGKKTE